MSTIEATVSMMEVMPEDARIKVMEYAQKQLNDFIDYIQYILLNDQAAKNVYQDALETIESLRTVASSLQ